jgi:membrane protein YqaA with SNARE-associated domain
MAMLEGFLQWMETLIPTYGYLGAFLVSFIGNASILLPIPSYLIIYAAGTYLDPFPLGAVAALGAALGEMVGYAVGYGIEKETHVEKKFGKQYETGKNLFKKYGFWVIPFFAATPLPEDVLGLAAGVLKYPASRFFIGCLIGKLVMYWAIAYGGQSSFALVKKVFGAEGFLVSSLVFVLLTAVIFLLGHRLNHHLKQG